MDPAIGTTDDGITGSETQRLRSRNELIIKGQRAQEEENKCIYL